MKSQICGPYIRMWPREVFDGEVVADSGKKKMLARALDTLVEPGAYILYRDDIPYYVGQATRLRSRLWQHAWNPNARYYNFWNFFSAFVVKDPDYRDQIESILIASMPTANSAKPRMERTKLPIDVVKFMRQIRRSRVSTN